jgi:hypothetical protein
MGLMGASHCMHVLCIHVELRVVEDMVASLGRIRREWRIRTFHGEARQNCIRLYRLRTLGISRRGYRLPLTNALHREDEISDFV